MEDFYLKMRDGEKIFIQYSINQEIDTTLLYVHGGRVKDAGILNTLPTCY